MGYAVLLAMLWTVFGVSGRSLAAASVASIARNYLVLRVSGHCMARARAVLHRFVHVRLCEIILRRSSQIHAVDDQSLREFR